MEKIKLNEDFDKWVKNWSNDEKTNDEIYFEFQTGKSTMSNKCVKPYDQYCCISSCVHAAGSIIYVGETCPL